MKAVKVIYVIGPPNRLPDNIARNLFVHTYSVNINKANR
jgi:hypothetical protein